MSLWKLVTDFKQQEEIALCLLRHVVHVHGVLRHVTIEVLARTVFEGGKNYLERTFSFDSKPKISS